MSVASQGSITVVTKDTDEYGDYEAELGLQVASRYPRLEGQVVRFAVIPPRMPKATPTVHPRHPARAFGSAFGSKPGGKSRSQQAMENIQRASFGEPIITPLFS